MLPHFNKGEPLLADQLNQIVDAIIARVKPGAGLLHRYDGDHFILSLDEIRIRQLAGVGVDEGGGPFSVGIGADSDGDATFTVVPGSVTGIVSTGDGIDDNPPGHSVDDGGAYSIYIQVTVGSDSDNNFRAKVTAVIVGTDNAEFAGDVGTLDPFELNMKWDNPDVRDTGYFYVKIADIEAATQGDPARITVTNLEQKWNQDILSFVIAGDEVIVLS